MGGVFNWIRNFYGDLAFVRSFLGHFFAKMSFIELVLAEAIAAGMVRTALREAHPPPENFFEIPPDPEV